MNILFITLLDFNTIEERGIYTDLLREFVKEKHKLYIVSPFESKVGESELILKQGYEILKLKIGNVQKTNFIRKGISMITLEAVLIREMNKYFGNKKIDLIIYSTPPITFYNVVKYFKKKNNAKTYLLLKDIFPQNAVDLNIFTKWNPIYWYFRYKEKKLYEISDYIGCMSPANVDYILECNPKISKDIIEVCPNSIEPMSVEKDNVKIRAIRKKYGIPYDKTVFIYGGNLGKPQGVDFLIECIDLNEKKDLSYFIIVGSGTEFNKLKDYFDKIRPKNASLLEQLSKNEYETLSNSCDVGLVFLDRRFTIPNFPSRILSYMQASIPILAATDTNTDIGYIIEKGRFGLWCESGKIDSFDNALNKLLDYDLRSEMGVNARKFLENNYTSKHSYDIIMKHFKM